MSATGTRRLSLTEIGARTFEVVEAGVCYRLNVPGAMASFEVDRCTWRRDELYAELMVKQDLLGNDAVDGVLSVASFNLSSARARTERASQLERQSRDRETPWHPLVEELCQKVLQAERTGEAAVPLRDIVLTQETDPLIDVFGFKLPRRHASIAFADGGATKSLLALFMAGTLARRGYRIGFFDWELDGIDHRERYETLFGESMPENVFYARCNRPLIYEVDRLKRIVRTQRVDYSVYDSIGFACHSRPEDAESALAYMRAARQINIGGLHLAHINRSETGDKQPFGSAFWHNSARATWFLKPTEEATGITVGVFNRKHNLAKYRQQPFAYEVHVDGDRTTFRLCEITAVSELAGQVPLAQRIKGYLRGGARTREELASKWPDEKPDTLRRVINREIEKGRLVRFPGPGGIERIGLKARAS